MTLYPHELHYKLDQKVEIAREKSGIIKPGIHKLKTTCKNIQASDKLQLSIRPRHKNLNTQVGLWWLEQMSLWRSILHH